MTNPAAISGQLVDVRNIATDKSIRLSIHVPAELAAQVIECFGWPTNVSPVPVAIARLVEEKGGGDAAKLCATPEQPRSTNSPSGRGSKSWHEMSAAQQAGILCGEASFQKFLRKTSEEEAARFVRSYCGVTSRSEINGNAQAERGWSNLVSEYRAWEAAPRAGL